MGRAFTQHDRRQSVLRWNPRQWADWLLNGLLQVAHAKSDEDIVAAFAPMTVSPRKIDTVIELTLRLAHEIPSCAHNFSAGLTLALQLWQPCFGRRVLSELLHFAEAFVPENAPALYGRVEILDDIGAIENTDERLDLVSQLVTALSMAPWNEQSDALVRELSERELWHQAFLGRIVLARAKSAPGCWLLLLHAHFDDLEAAYAGFAADRALMLDELVGIAGLRRVVSTTLAGPPLDDGVNLESFKRMLEALYCGADPIISITDEGLNFRGKRWPTPATDTAEILKWSGRRKPKEAPPPGAVANMVHSYLTRKAGLTLGTKPDDIEARFKILRGPDR